MTSKLQSFTFVFFVAMILIIPLNSQKSYATHLSDDTKWQLVFVTHNPVCSNYDFQSVSKYTEITAKYLESYQFPNSNYDSICTTLGKLSYNYNVPKDLDLLIIMLDNDLGEEKLNSVKLGGLYAHSGLDKDLNHVILICDCSNFYYSDPVWTLSHELSHFVLYSLNYDSKIIETLVHTYDDTYDRCRESYSSECSKVVEKIRVDNAAYSYSVMPPYDSAIGVLESETQEGTISPQLIQLNKFITQWWSEGKINEADYGNALGYLVSEEELSDLKSRDIMFADGPVDDPGPNWFDIIKYPGTNNKEKLFSIIPYDFESDLNRVYEDDLQIGLPSWFKQTATWWLDDKITDDEFTKSVKYLRDMGLIQPH